MGIQLLWGELQAYGHDVALPRLHESLARRRNGSADADIAGTFGPQIRLGIDVALWRLHADRKTTGAYAPVQRLVYQRLCRLLSLTHLSPVFVFEGPASPRVKRGQHAEDLSNNFCTRRNRQINDVKAMIDAFGFVWIDAPGEAEAELADLNRRGLLDAVLSDDVDCFLFGAHTVVRNWSHTLSGTKARKAYQQRVTSPTTDSDEALGGGDDANLTALKENLITYYCRDDFSPSLQDPSGCLLSALLSGGDYDTDGLHRCGIKTCMELTNAGFGTQLYAGAKEHLRASENDGVPTFRTSESAWQTFMHQWRSDVQVELSHNRTGLMSMKRKALARSDGMSTLLSTPDSLAVLARYVFPAISKREFLPDATLQEPDVQRIAMLLGLQLHWRRNTTLTSMHNNLYVGYMLRRMISSIVVLPSSESALPPNNKSVKRSTITSFFKSNGKASSLAGPAVSTTKDYLPARTIPRMGPVAPEHTAILQSIIRERRHPSTGLLAEVYVQCDVQELLHLAEKGITAAQEIDATLTTSTQLGDEDEEGDEDTPAAATDSMSDDDGTVEEERAPATRTSTPRSAVRRTPSQSPRKAKQSRRYNPGQPLRAWVERDAIAASAEGRSHLDRFDAEQARKKSLPPRSPKKGKTAAHDDGRKQTTLSMFYSGTKGVSRPATAAKGVVQSPPATLKPTRAPASPSKSSLLESLQAIAPPPHDDVRVSPTKRRPIAPLSSSSSPSDEDGASSNMFARPPSPSAQKRDRQLRTRRSHSAAKGDTHGLPANEASTPASTADNSVEFVSQRLCSVTADTAPGSITISDDEE